MIETEIGREALIERIDELLEARYRSADLFNLDDPLEETVFILLSQQTREPLDQERNISPFVERWHNDCELGRRMHSRDRIRANGRRGRTFRRNVYRRL